MKECDRIYAVTKNLYNGFGIHSKISADNKSLSIYFKYFQLKKCIIKCYNDHRIAMAFSLLSAKIK